MIKRSLKSQYNLAEAIIGILRRWSCRHRTLGLMDFLKDERNPIELLLFTIHSESD